MRLYHDWSGYSSCVIRSTVIRSSKTEMLQGQTAAPGNLSRLYCLQTWTTLTLGHSELFLHAAPVQQRRTFLPTRKSASTHLARHDADTGGQHAFDARRPWGRYTHNQGRNRVTRRANICLSAHCAASSPSAAPK